MEHHRRVFIYRNEAVALGELLIYDPSISLETLKSLAGQKLGLNPARRVFLVSGAEVKGESELQNGDNLYFSAGEPFYRISTNTNEKIDVAILGAGGVGKSALALRYLRDTFVQHYDATIQDVYQKTVRYDGAINVLDILDTAGQEDFVSMRSQWMMDKDGYIFVYSLLDKSSLRQLFNFVDLLSQVCDGYEKAPPVVFVGTKGDLVERDPSTRVVTLEEVRYVIEGYEEASRALDRRQSMRFSSSNLGTHHTGASHSVNSMNDSFQSSGIMFETTLDSPSPNGKNIGLSEWMEALHFETSALTGKNVDEAFMALVREVRARRKEAETPTAPVKRSWMSTYCNIL